MKDHRYRSHFYEIEYPVPDWANPHEAMLYARGKLPPNYPVPAIRQGFEYGRSLGTGEIILLHWHQEAV